MLDSADCVVLAVHDLEAATDSYTLLFGRPPAERPEPVDEAGLDEGLETVRFPLRNTALVLTAVRGRGPLADTVSSWLKERDEGLMSLVFRTSDVEACEEELRARGLLGGAPQTPADAGRRRLVLPRSATRGTLLAAVEHGPGDEPEGLAAPSAGAEPGKVEALDHIVVRSPDLDAAGRLYGDGLGLRLALDRSFEQRGLRMLFFRVGGVTVEVVGSLREAPGADEPDRFGGLAWSVDDVAAARDRLVAEGFDVTEQRAGHKPGTRVCTVRSGTCNVPTLIIGPE